MNRSASPASPKSLPLILARELAANLATPMFLLDAGGMLVFYNDAAALLLGKPFAELGEIPSGEFGAVARARDARRRAPAPARLAGRHRVLRAAGRAPDASWRPSYDGVRRSYEATAYPLFGATGEMHGVVAVFWEAADAGEEATTDARPRLGMPRLGRRARRRHRQVRRQHVVRRGAPRERARARARRRHRHAAARRGDAATTCRSSCTSCSRICTWTICRASGSSGRCSRPGSTSTSGARRRRCSTSPSASRCTSRRRCFPVHLDDVPVAPHVPRRARGAGDDRLGDDPRRQGDAPGPDRRVPDRGARPRARVPPRSRAVDRRRPRDESRASG